MLACRPMLSLAVALLAGILIERYLRCFANVWLFAALAFAVCGLLFFLSPQRYSSSIPESLPASYARHIVPVPGYFARRGLNRFILLLCLAAMIAGLARQYAWRRARVPERLPEKHWFTARLVAREPSHSFPGEDGYVSVAAGLISVDGETVDAIPVRLRCGEVAPFRRGDILYGRVRRMGDAPPAFPGAFEFGFFLERDGLLATLQAIRSNKSVNALQVTPTGSVPFFQRCMRLIDSVRGLAIRRTLEYGGSQGGLLAAMLFGYRKNIGDEIRDSFRRVGIGHVLAISGLHVGLVVGMLWWLGGWVGWTSRVRATVCLLLALFYWGLTGGQVAATRATLMAVIHLAGIAGGRRGDMLNSLGAAAFFIALWNPSAPVDVSFQLSFIAVVFIYMTLRRTPPPEPERRTPDPRYNAVWRRRIAREIAGLVWLSIATWVGLFPIIALVFKQVNLAGLPINIAVIPLMSLVLAGGLLLPWLGWIPGVGWLLTLPSWLLTKLAGIVDVLPGSSFPVHAPGYVWIVLFYLFVAALMIAPMIPAGRFRWRWNTLAAAALALSFLGILVSMRSRPAPQGGRIALLPGAGTDLIAAESPEGGLAIIGTVRRGGINEAAWFHYQHRKGPVAVVSMGVTPQESLSALSWHYPLYGLTVVPATRKADAKSATGWLPVPGAPGVECSLTRDEKGRVLTLGVKTGDKSVMLMPRIRAERFAEIMADADTVPSLTSVYFSESQPRLPDGFSLSKPVAVRGRLPAGADACFFRRTNFGVLLAGDKPSGFDGSRWRPILCPRRTAEQSGKISTRPQTR